MFTKYDNLDDLWCEWGEVTSAAMKHMDQNEPVRSKLGWSFEEARIVTQSDNSYSLFISHTAFDEEVGERVRLDVQAFVTPDEAIEVQTNKREVIIERGY